MVSGHFDGLHSDHLKYIEQASKYGDVIICIVSTDKQLIMKKGQSHISEKDRLWLVETLLWGDRINHIVRLNEWDRDTPSVAEALRYWKPNIFYRGFDKKPDDMPEAETKVCMELGIEVIYAKDAYNEHRLHSSEVFG